MAATKPAEQAETYVWEGTDKRGAQIKGEQSGRNPSLVKAELRRQGITPTKVKRKPKPLFGEGKQRIKPQDIAFFSRQLSTMLDAGVPLVQAFDIIGGGHKNPSMRELVGQIKNDVEGGSTLSEALARHPKYFDELYINLVAAGESAGVLDSLLDTIATYKERMESLKGKIKKALFYPVAVIVVAIVVTAILLLYVVPQFENMFQNFGADLPAFTQFVIMLSDELQANGWIYFLAIAGSVTALLMAYKRSRRFAHAMDRFVLRLPIVGDVLHKSSIARFARTLSITFAAGVPLVEALYTVAGATGNVVYSDAVHKIREDVATGHQLQLAMRQTNLFPHMVIQMTAIGEESGALDKMLTKVADYYEEEVNNTVDSLSSLLEPLIMVVIGVLVGGLIVAMYLPIFKLASVV